MCSCCRKTSREKVVPTHFKYRIFIPAEKSMAVTEHPFELSWKEASEHWFIAGAFPPMFMAMWGYRAAGYDAISKPPTKLTHENFKTAMTRISDLFAEREEVKEQIANGELPAKTKVPKDPFPIEIVQLTVSIINLLRYY